MAKTIKFNLICDNKPIRTIEDLQNNFSVEDIYNYYNNGLLERWLEVRGYVNELERVKTIIHTNPVEIIKELVNIFDVTCDNKKIEESIYIFTYLEESKIQNEVYEKEKYKLTSILSDYRSGYEQLVNTIIDNPNDIAIIRANIIEMVNKYEWILSLDHRRLFNLFNKYSRLAIMCLLMNEKTRNYYLPVLKENGNGAMYEDIITDEDKHIMFQSICNMVKTSVFRKELGENLRSFSGVTDGYWKDLEIKGKKYMIISMGEGDFLRPADEHGGDLSSKDVKNKFVIVDGIDYKSNSLTRTLYYMEV